VPPVYPKAHRIPHSKTKVPPRPVPQKDAAASFHNATNSTPNGKTHLAAAAANHLIVQGKVVLFATAPELLAMVRQGFDDP
jgi:hypothetical protein